MKCRETHYWLYSLRPNASWPVEVVTHLQGCNECRALQARLKQVDDEIGKLIALPVRPTAKEQLLARIERTLQTPARRVPTVPFPWARVAGYLSAAAALLLLGWFGGRHFKPADIDPKSPGERIVEVPREKLVEIFRDRIVTVESQADRSLFTVLLKRNSRLVQAVQVKDRLDTLLDMADDCRKHALTLIDQGPRESLPFTIDLYIQLLRDGALVQMQQGPTENRITLKAAVRSRLQEMAKPQNEPKPLPKVVEDQREALENATKQAISMIDWPAAPAVKKPQAFVAVAPAAALVQFAIAFSAEAEPIAQADLASSCVNRLMPYMMLCLAEESTPNRGEMGEQFGEMIQFGVYKPLTSADPAEPPQKVKDQTERILKETVNAVAEMEKNIDGAQDNAKAALQRMVDTSKKGWEKNKGKGAPAWLRDPFQVPKGKPQKKSSLEPPMERFNHRGTEITEENIIGKTNYMRLCALRAFVVNKS